MLLATSLIEPVLKSSVTPISGNADLFINYGTDAVTALTPQ